MFRLKQNIKKIFSYLSFDVSDKLISLLSSLLILRTLDKSSFAVYTLIYSILGGVTIATSLGVPTALNAEGGKYFEDKDRFSSLVATCKQQRLFFIKLFLPIVIIYTLFLLHRMSVEWYYSILSVIIIGASLTVGFISDIAQSVIRLSGDYSYIPRFQACASVIRLFILFVLYITNSINLFLILGSAFIVNAYVALRYFYNRSKRYYIPQAIPNPSDARRIMSITYNTLPEQLSAFIMPQLQVIVLSIFSNYDSVADIGALSKVSLIYSFPTALFVGIIYPWLARARSGDVLSRYRLTVMAFSGVSILIFSTIFIFKSQILSLFGPNYTGLNHELVLVSGASSLSLIFTGLLSILNARGKVNGLWLITLSSTLLTLISISLINASVLSQVLTLSYIRFIPMTFLALHLISKAISELKYESAVLAI